MFFLEYPLVWFILIRILVAVFTEVRRSENARQLPSYNLEELLDYLYKTEFVYTKLPDKESREASHAIRGLYANYFQALGRKDIDFFYLFLQHAVKNKDLLFSLKYLGGRRFGKTLALIREMEIHRGIRQIEDWQPADLINVQMYFADLINHLFALYPVHPVIAALWWDEEEAFFKFAGQNVSDLKEWQLKLFFHLAEGGSLRENELIRKNVFSKKTAHLFLQAPFDSSFKAAYLRAEYLAQGAPEAKMNQILPVIFILENMPFWRVYFRLLANTGKGELAKYDLYTLTQRLKWAKFGRSQLLENANPVYPKLELKGRTLASLWRLLRALPFQDFPSVPRLADQETLEINGQTFQMVRLRKVDELIEEGAAMRHCVGDDDYAYACMAGESSIWSLRTFTSERNWKRELTVDLENGTVVEAVGFNNAPPQEEQVAALRKWVECNALSSHF